MNINVKSIRIRLTIWYFLSFFVVTVLVFASFWVVTRKVLIGQTEASLATHGAKVIEMVQRRGDNMNQMMVKEAFLAEFAQIPGMLVVVEDNGGNIVNSSLSFNLAQNTLFDFYEKAAKTGKPFYDNKLIGDTLMRFLVSPVFFEDGFLGVVFIAHSIDVIEQALARLMFLLVGAFGILLFPTLVGGYFFAKGAMLPIIQITHKLKRISSQNLEERVENPKTNDEMEDLALSFNNLLDRLRESFLRERQFIADLAHELKTPLANLQASIELVLSSQRKKEEYKKVLSETLTDTQRLTNTLRNVLDLAYFEADMSSNNKVFSLSSLAEEVADITEKLAFKKKIEVKKNINSDINCIGNKEGLFRAFLNIIDNAVKFTQEKGKILISLERKSDLAILGIEDSGIGIDKSDLAHIFERFYRGNKSKKITGAGIGLAIALAIIKVHKGEIKVKSQVKKGTTVKVFLPSLLLD